MEDNPLQEISPRVWQRKHTVILSKFADGGSGDPGWLLHRLCWRLAERVENLVSGG